MIEFEPDALSVAEAKTFCLANAGPILTDGSIRTHIAALAAVCTVGISIDALSVALLISRYTGAGPV